VDEYVFMHNLMHRKTAMSDDYWHD